MVRNRFTCGLLVATLIIFSSMATRVSTSDLPSGQIKVMNFNARQGTFDSGEAGVLKRWPVALAIIRAEGPDFLAMQEVYLKPAISMFTTQTVAAEGWLDSLVSVGGVSEFCGPGNEVLESTVRSLPGTNRWYSLRLLDGPVGEYYVLNTHWELDEGLRQETARALVAEVKPVVGNKPLVILGDFNATEDEACYRILKEGLGLFDAYRVANPAGSGETLHGFAGLEGETARIDYILVSDHFRVVECYRVRTVRDHPSDHYPLVAVLERR